MLCSNAKRGPSAWDSCRGNCDAPIVAGVVAVVGAMGGSIGEEVICVLSVTCCNNEAIGLSPPSFSLASFGAVPVLGILAANGIGAVLELDWSMDGMATPNWGSFNWVGFVFVSVATVDLSSVKDIVDMPLSFSVLTLGIEVGIGVASLRSSIIHLK